MITSFKKSARQSVLQLEQAAFPARIGLLLALSHFQTRCQSNLVIRVSPDISDSGMDSLDSEGLICLWICLTNSFIGLVFDDELFCLSHNIGCVCAKNFRTGPAADYVVVVLSLPREESFCPDSGLRWCKWRDCLETIIHLSILAPFRMSLKQSLIEPSVSAADTMNVFAWRLALQNSSLWVFLRPYDPNDVSQSSLPAFSPLHHTQLAGFINYPLGWSEYGSYIRFCASYQFFVEVFVRFDVCMCQRTVRNQECEKTYIIFWMLILEHHLNTHFTICSLVAGFECALVGSIDWGCKLLQYFDSLASAWTFD